MSPVCTKCGKSSQLVDEEVIVEKGRKQIRKHPKPCKGTKKSGECGSTSFKSGPKDDALARKIAIKKGLSEEEANTWPVTLNPAEGFDELETAYQERRQWIETIEDEAQRNAEVAKAIQCLQDYEDKENVNESKEEVGASNSEDGDREEAD
jgi:hypothetical protein